MKVCVLFYLSRVVSLPFIGISLLLAPTVCAIFILSRIDAIFYSSAIVQTLSSVEASAWLILHPEEGLGISIVIVTQILIAVCCFIVSNRLKTLYNNLSETSYACLERSQQVLHDISTEALYDLRKNLHTTSFKDKVHNSSAVYDAT